MKAYSYINRAMPNTGSWQERHKRAVEGYEPIPQALRSWCAYAEAHAKRFDSPIGQDYVLGHYWAQWGGALLGLLNGETGGLDCGTVDGIIRDNLRDQGFDPDEF